LQKFKFIANYIDNKLLNHIIIQNLVCYRYGDRAPKSVVARLFAITWILFGITIFSMYTAALTTALTTSVSDLTKTTMKGKKVCTFLY